MRVDVGIDVGKDSLDFCLLLNQTKCGRKFSSFKNRKINYFVINDWLLKQAKCQPHEIVITMESMGVYPKPLVLFLYTSGFQVIL